MILGRVIVLGIGAPVRRFDAQIVAQDVARHEIVEVARGAAIVETRGEGAVAAAVQGDRTARIEGAALGLQVDDSGGAQSILGGQCAIDERHRGNQPRIQRLAEDTDAFGQDDAVQPILQAVVLAAHVELAERILGDVGRLHDHLIQQIVVAAGGRSNGRLIDDVGGGTGLGLDAVAGLVQVLCDDRDGIELLSVVGVRGRTRPARKR